MVTLWPWAAGLVVVAAVAAVVWAVAGRGRTPRTDDVRWVARADELRQVPQIRRALRRAAVLRALGALAVVAGLVAAGVLVARPAEQQTHSPQSSSRDIVLCLDVSGSMAPFDTEILRTFTRLVDGFTGERIALSIFNSTSRTVFPLTDDYALVLDELREAADALSYDVEGFDPESESSRAGFDRLLELLAGTSGVPDQASLVGDGLASCALLFDEGESERSRSIVLATDNEVFGEPIYTLPQAVDVVAARDVGLYGLYGGAEELRGSTADEEFTASVTAAAERVGHGGAWYAEDPAAVRGILDDVARQQLAALEGRPTVVVVDRPGPWPWVLLAALALVVGVRWRTRT